MNFDLVMFCQRQNMGVLEFSGAPFVILLYGNTFFSVSLDLIISSARLGCSGLKTP